METSISPTKSELSLNNETAVRPSVEYASKKGWLLRLFQSDFFNTWIATSYLFKYSDVGIQHYLCEELKKSPIKEIEFILPQLTYETFLIAGIY